MLEIHNTKIIKKKDMKQTKEKQEKKIIKSSETIFNR
jgi:hypothetical protein